ncbi:lymphocyte antigen 6D [Acanthochromis polyacanthus]|uniref:lymphocyte antigen 6D n=1 Tax=Acanthochromis polyacanthus TaxID=80966 RepID=UPI000B909AFA|nr:lymphocyte antigen 6D [Acanthochromis polyacanthus]
MKVLLLMALLLLCSTQVLTLKCYTCDDGADCKTETDCPPSSVYCKTTAHGDEFSRTCEEDCDEDFFTTCCQQDLC